MSTKPPPPCPPPRPDLEDESLVPSSKPSKAAPPPIPVRPDLGEGIDDHASSSVHIPKIPPPTLPKKASFNRHQGKQEITIVSAQPIASSGAFSPFVPTAYSTDKPAPSSGAVEPPDLSNVDLTPLTKHVAEPAYTTFSDTTVGANYSGQSATPTSQSSAHEVVSSPPQPAPVPTPVHDLPSTAPTPAAYDINYGKSAIPSSQNIAAFSPFGSESFSSVPVARNQSQPSLSPFGDDFSIQAANSGSITDPFASPVQPLKPPSQISPQIAGVQAPQPLKPPPTNPAPYNAVSQPSRPVAPCPPTPTVPDSTLQYARPAPPVPSNVSPLRVSTKSNRPREPPQRPKSKPVCEPSLTNDPFQVGLANKEAERLAEPIAPKRKKNKTSKGALQESTPEGSGINNSAFQDYEPNQMDNKLKIDEDVQMKKDGVNPPTSKKSKFPTVIRTKPNGKEAPKSDSSASNLNDLKELEFDSAKVKYTKPTVIKPQGRAKPPPPPPTKQATQEPALGNSEQLVSVPQSEPEPQQAKSKPKPTIIIPKAKKDETKKAEVVTSPSGPSKSETEPKKDQGEKAKPKRMPSIIRPNRKKDKNQAAANSPQNSRGMPEGQSQESSSKLLPTRKAPPRPSPPKPGPPRPGPPKRAANVSGPQTRTQPLGNVTTEDVHSENTQRKGMAPPRPATIGRDIDADHHKTVKHKKKKEETTVVSSVVTTNIEPSCIALYDYDSGNADDLSFKAGDEIFLVKRINHEWYIGRLDEYEGMIPLKFVEIIEDLPPEPEQSGSKAASKTSSLTTVALYSFNGQADDELTFHAGDTIQLTEMINEEWLKGTCNGATGMFPSNFVDFTPEIKQKLSELKHDQGQATQDNKTLTVSDVMSGPRCKAFYDYHTDNDNDLNFFQDDIIKLVERINDEWLKGEINGKVGMFPAAYVEIIEDLIDSPEQLSQESSSFAMAKAIHNYISDADGDLSFQQGDMITILKTINEEWLEGELHGQKGMFPSTFVEIVGESTHQIDTHQALANLQPKGKALYDFTGETEHELTFKAGDEILLLQHINDDWMEGEVNDHIGQFPTAFIEVLVPLP